MEWKAKRTQACSRFKSFSWVFEHGVGRKPRGIKWLQTSNPYVSRLYPRAVNHLHTIATPPRRAAIRVSFVKLGERLCPFLLFLCANGPEVTESLLVRIRGRNWNGFDLGHKNINELQFPEG